MSLPILKTQTFCRFYLSKKKIDTVHITNDTLKTQQASERHLFKISKQSWFEINRLKVNEKLINVGSGRDTHPALIQCQKQYFWDSHQLLQETQK